MVINLKLIKIAIIFIFIFIIAGCNNDYQSLNDLVIVSSILIDKGDNTEYITYLELYKQEKDSDNNNSYFIKGYGNNIQDAINNASNSISKKLYLIHTNAVIISKSLASEKINEVFNYLESKVGMNSNYYLLISDNINDLVKNQDKDTKILGEKIFNTLKYSTNSGTMVNYDFMEKLNNYLNKRKDIYLSKISVKNNQVEIKDGYFFSKNKLAGNLDNNEIKLINLFKNSKDLYFTFDYNNDQYMIKVDKKSIKYNINKSINININIKANIVEVGSNIDILKSSSIDKLNKHSEYSLENRLNELIYKLKNNNSDILGINNYIYKLYGKNISDYFIDDVILNVDVDINKKGLINKTLGGNYE